MAVAFDQWVESHTGTTGSTSQSSFNWTHTPVGTPRGVLVLLFTVTGSSTAPTATASSITYGSASLSQVSGSVAKDTATECGNCEAWFVGSSIPTGAQTVTVNRTNNTDTMYAVSITITAAGDTEVYAPGIVLLQENGTYTEQNVTDGSPGTNSLRFAGGYSGGSNVLGVGANSTVGPSIDFGLYTATVCRETTAGQGSRPVGFSYGTSDDRAGTHLAVREVSTAKTGDASLSATATITADGIVFTGVTGYASDLTGTGSTAKTVAITWNAGDTVTVLGIVGDNVDTGRSPLGTPSFSGGSFSSIDLDTTSSGSGTHCWGGSWQCQPANGGSGDVSVTPHNGAIAQPWGFIVVVADASLFDGIGVHGLPNSTNVYVQNLTVGEGSAVAMLLGDWGAAAVTGRSWTPSGQTELGAGRVTGEYSYLTADWPAQGAGNRDYGVTGLTTTQPVTRVYVEILATSGGSFTGNASLSGTATIAATGAAAKTGAAAFSGTATLTATGSANKTGAAAFSGTATIASAGSANLATGAAVSATATLTATGSVTTGLSSGAAFSGTATLTATGTGATSSGAGFTGTATIAATGVVGKSSGAAFSGTATIMSAGAAGKSTGAAFSATATIATAGATNITGAAALSGTATLAATGAVASGLSSGASLSATAAITATAKVATFGTATLSGTATIAATGTAAVVGYTGNAALSGTATLTSTGKLGLVGAAAVTGAATITATGNIATFGAAALVGTATLDAAGLAAGPGVPVPPFTVTGSDRPAVTVTSTSSPAVTVTATDHPAVTVS